MTAREPDGLVWRKSSFSANGGACVEVGWRDATTAVRDSKDGPRPGAGLPGAGVAGVPR